jgi:hypothetical protein
MNRYTIIIGLALITIGFIAMVLFSDNSFTASNERELPALDPIDVATGVANRWLQNERATSSVSMAVFIASEPLITRAAGNRLIAQSPTPGETRDPILCQTSLPVRVGARSVYQTEDSAQVMIVARGANRSAERSIMTLVLDNNAWRITNIVCANENARGSGEFAFEAEGRLVRESIPNPYDPNVWHLVVERPDGSIDAVPLAFTDTSICRSDDGELVTCDQSQFTEGDFARVQADVTETNAVVLRLEPLSS